MDTIARYIALIIVTFIPSFIPAVAYAQSTVPSAVQTTVTTPGSVVQTAPLSAAKLTTLHTRCDTEITTRLTSLNQALTRINGLQKLSATQKQNYVSSIQSDISGLTSLKAKCDADTVTTVLQADVKSIVTSYRIYLEFLPQIALLAASDRLQSVSDLFSTLATKLQIRLTDAQSQGVSSTVLAPLQADLQDLQTKMVDVSTQSSTITSQVGSLQPASVNTNATGTKTDFQAARTALQTAQSDIRAAFADAKTIVAGVQAFRITETTPGTGSAVTTIVNTVTPTP